MNLVAAAARVIVAPYVRIWKAARAPVTGFVRARLSDIGAAWNLLVHEIPQKTTALLDQGRTHGENMCYGKNAPFTIAPGILLREACGLAYRQRNITGLLAYGGGLALGAALAATIASPLAFATLPGFLALAALFYAPAGAAVYTAGTVGLMTAGATLHSLPAILSLPIGIKCRREAIADEERKKRDADALDFDALQKLAPMDRHAYYCRHDTAAATPAERTQWFEELKAKFPAEFAAAAIPDPGELSPVLAKDVRLGKPLRLKIELGKPEPPRKRLLGWLFRR